ncbi:MAG TPA: potassium transporter Kup [Candidatus Saccharimonadales bacterium]|nr:potassium transporter Kup [Candidatus Saccharimonadales bacterium]
MAEQSAGRRLRIGLMVGALGVVYGDIGTSPLYALRECFVGEHGAMPTPEHVMGVLSLIFWSLILIVCLKYLTFVIRADNKGEGGILSLAALAFGDTTAASRRRALLLILGVFGAALLYGDGLITPCISVLGAMEGLKVATPFFEPYIVPITILVLVGLFSFQKIGTESVGKIFGPMTLLWFLTIAALGVRGILMAPRVLHSLSPHHGLEFLVHNGFRGFMVLGAVFLAVTGAEALYADLGHFGAKPIRAAWFSIVFPSLFLNYLGQGGLLLANPSAIENPFFMLAPKWLLFPLVGLATFASVIASQALISGAFSITMQAIQLGYLPRMSIKHTSSAERGQIYMPTVNWALLIGCVGIVLGFQNSSRLSAAYGIAVTLTMLITTVLFFFAARRIWKWSLLGAGSLCALFLSLELIYFGANALKVAHGGWFPLLIAAVVFTVMTTWKTGRRLLGERLSTGLLPFEIFLGSIQELAPHRVRGTAVFMSGNPEGTPLALLHNLKHNQVLHERVVLLTISTTEVPHLSKENRVRFEALSDGFYRVIACYGFMETPNIREVLRSCEAYNLKIDPEQATYFLSRETIIATPLKGMAMWREHLFAFMVRNAQTATLFFNLPANRVVELGMQIEF